MKRQAFSLVELSIVLVILGLLVGGVLSGQSLIRAAQLRGVATEYQRYMTATQSFRDKYFALPGDMTNATSFWTSLGGNGANATCQNTATNGAATCNGDGNGIISITNSNGVAESYRYWQHLANAGLIEGNYNGKLGVTLGLNFPVSKIASATFIVMPGGGYYAGDTFGFAGDWGNNMYNFTNAVIGTPLKPEEAWNIDTKLDDGRPGGGAIYAGKGDGTTTFCTTGDNLSPPADANATYRLDKTGKDCALSFLRVF
jgi:prepilin-type N-terminal cleavage/methylation domain-containing protein